MTKKDYVLIAKCIQSGTIQDEPEVMSKHNLLNALCVALKNDNPLFDEVRFREACK